MKYERYKSVDGSAYKAVEGKDGITDNDMRVLKRVVKSSQKTESKFNRLQTVSIEVVTEDGWQDMDVAVIVEDRDEYERLHKAIAALPPDQQELIRAVYFQGIGQREIARTNSVSEHKIRYHLKRIYAALKISLE